MNWINLETEAQLAEIQQLSHTQPVVIMKHSTRCSISTMAKGRMDRAVQPDGVAFYYLDLLAHRPLSQRIAELFGVHHESPQILLIRNGECTYDESHNGIDMDDLVEQL